MAKDSSKKPGGKSGKKIRVDFRKNREKTARDKTQWTRHYRDASIKHEDTAASESVRAKGAQSRKRTIIEGDAAGSETDLRLGTVVRLRGLVAEVDDGGQLWACTVRRVLRTLLIKERHPITVGDRVRFLPVELAGAQSRQISDDRDLPEGVIEQVQERTSTLVRHYDRRIQAVVANVDVALIVAAADQPTLRPHLIDRYLIAVHQGDMRPIICINKTDLDTGGAAHLVADRYRDVGYTVLETSVTDRRGLDALREAIKNQTCVLVGPSGVGKSSLLNALDPDLSLRIGSLTDLQRGRHTTTTATLLKWCFGGYIVDTPGMRQFDLSELESTEVEAYFPEFVDRVAGCRFPDCSHTHEIGCAVKAALEEGAVTPERYESYCKIYRECRDKEAR